LEQSSKIEVIYMTTSRQGKTRTVY